MSAVFNKKEPNHLTYDQFDIMDRSFSVMVVCDTVAGGDKSIQGGRITYFMMTEEDLPAFDWKALCLYKDGKWEIEIPKDDDAACIAAGYLINKWNREVLSKNLKEEDFCKAIKFA